MPCVGGERRVSVARPRFLNLGTCRDMPLSRQPRMIAIQFSRNGRFLSHPAFGGSGRCRLLSSLGSLLAWPADDGSVCALETG